MKKLLIFWTVIFSVLLDSCYVRYHYRDGDDRREHREHHDRDRGEHHEEHEHRDRD